MKKVLTSSLVPGMQLAADILTSIGQRLLTKGTVLTDADITRLEFYSIISVGIEDKVETSKTDTKTQETISYFDRLRERKEYKEYKELFEADVSVFENTCNHIVEEDAQIDVEDMMDMIQRLMKPAKEICGVFDMLHNLRSYDDESFSHSVNVALICNVFAGWLNMSDSDRELTTMCGLFHDIGKTKISKSLLRKKEKLTEDEYKIIQNHTVEGYNILMSQNVDEHIKNAALLHHERYDGSGYPLGLAGDKTDEFAKIVGIADVYDSITSPRIYRKALCPFTVIELFEKEGLEKYDPKYLLVFLENIVNTYLQNKVKLSNGEIGTILMINRNALSRPLVRTKNHVYDLQKENDLRILEIC